MESPETWRQIGIDYGPPEKRLASVVAVLRCTSPTRYDTNWNARQEGGALIQEPMAEQQKLWMVGCLRSERLAVPHPMSERDVAADTKFADALFERFGIGAGSLVLFTSGAAEYAQFWPYEQALESRKACLAIAENLGFDAGRSEMFMRRLTVDLAFGIGHAVLDGMSAMSLDIHKAFAAAPAICARDGAADRLRALGFAPWRMVTFGPTFGFVSPEGETLYDHEEWLLEAPHGEILISAKRSRAHPLARFRTGIQGSVDSRRTFTLA